MIKKISLYWKTWLITVTTILLTLGVFFIIFSQFATYFLEDAQKNRFNQGVKEIKTYTEKNGIDPNYLGEYYRSGFLVTIVKGENLIFPVQGISGEVAGVVPFTEELQVNESTKAYPSEAVTIMNTTIASNSLLTMEENITYQGEVYRLWVSYPLSLNKEDIQQVLTSVTPFFLGIGLIVSFVVSIIYAKYFSSKITRLNTAINQMADGTLIEEHFEKEGDELQELENNLHRMYQDLQSALQQLNQEVQVVKRLEKDRQLFMRGATHELKTPIMAMSTMLEGMLENVEGYENRDQYLKACYGRLQSMGKLVNEMLEVSRIEGIIYQGKTNLKIATEEVIDIYRYMLEDKAIDLLLSELFVTEIEIPKRNLQKVLSNLIGNAVKYTPEQGSIRIYSNQEIWSITNTMKEGSIKDASKIFEPFVSYEEQSENEFDQSHGLGLYIVDAILTQYGIVYDYSIDGEKNTFEFKLELGNSQE
ncbi:sensor histidine kinase [Carnobacterium gallinarum]|uniref:HAMP domain-containing sensor histidine kinase n=1 Tax=Carnobacterium gallinarum TaxID=2749 RepID=UPI0005530B64|nr:HAMP domain-containing sensor histidine kinase [Carnobacterium gallinarum]